ncbi:MAG: type II toxin-antitoxin system VapC family toxin [Phormidesmis sp.]
MGIDAWFDKAINSAGIELLPITSAIACRAVELSPIHKDPFDRLIIATAIVHNANLASVDRLFPRYLELEGRLMSS